MRRGVDLSQRASDREIMDDPTIVGPQVERALREIAAVNRFLGGAAASLAGLKPLLSGREHEVRLLDVGAGGADIPVAIARWCRRQRIRVRIVAVDLGGDACRFAHAVTREYPEIDICRADVFALPYPPRSFHLAHCAMFLHHFTQDEIARILDRLAAIVREAIVINDLHRHAIAYHSIRILTRFLSRSRLVRNDAPLSVRRGFRPPDLDDIRERCRFPRFRYRWRWAFRYLCEVGVTDTDPAERAACG